MGAWPTSAEVTLRGGRQARAALPVPRSEESVDDNGEPWGTFVGGDGSVPNLVHDRRPTDKNEERASGRALLFASGGPCVHHSVEVKFYHPATLSQGQ